MTKLGVERLSCPSEAFDHQDRLLHRGVGVTKDMRFSTSSSLYCVFTDMLPNSIDCSLKSTLSEHFLLAFMASVATDLLIGMVVQIFENVASSIAGVRDQAGAANQEILHARC